MIQILFIFFAVYSTPLQKGMMYGYRTPLVNKVDPRCYAEDYIRAWVYFTDKGIHVNDYDKAIKTATSRMNRASIERRMLRQGVIDYADIPLSRDYIDEVEARGGLLIRRSKWLNAASFWITRQDIDKIADLDFIYKVTMVAAFKNPGEIESAVQDTAVFGYTYQQSKMFNIDKLHDMGVFGSNVKVGILDTGLRRKHIALNITKIVAEYDFLGGDQIFAENDPITDQYGIYSNMVFHRTVSRLNLFVAGDTTVNYKPARDVFYTYSTDNGTTWSSLRNITNNSYGSWARILDVCGQDTMFIFFRNRAGLKYTIDYNDAAIGSGTLDGFSYREPSAVQINDTVYVVYQSKNNLHLKKGGISGFGSRITIDSSTSNIKSPKIVAGDAKLGVFYHIYPEDSLYFLQSSVPETTFTRGFISMGKDADAISIADTIFLIWKDTSNEPLFRIAFTKSTDFGNTFTQPEYLSDNMNSTGKISIEKSTSTITVAWESKGKIYFKTSSDNGNNFGNLDSLNKEFVYLPTLGTNSNGIVKFYCTRGDSSTDGYASTDDDYFHPRHGTEMLGLIGGYLSGQYVGVAPGAQFLVAKTENPDASVGGYEFPVEEDTWISGLEWLEANGADIVNSSLGYTTWYNPEDYDGKTSPASIAAYEATRRGVIVVNAAGNVTIPQIVIPGDAEGVITVGGIDTLFYRWNLSGYGPTSDGRIKPEIMCLSAAPVVINPDTSDKYFYSFGTSGATAMISGICALLLEAHPNWNVDSVRSALFNTASYATTPTDSMGYGWPDALAAFNYSPADIDTVAGSGFLDPYPNPFILSQHNNIFFPFKLNQSASVQFRVYSITGRLIREEDRPDLLPPGHYTDTNQQSPNAVFVWDGKDENGNEVGSGIYYCLLITHGAGNDVIKIAVIR